MGGQLDRGGEASGAAVVQRHLLDAGFRRGVSVGLDLDPRQVARVVAYLVSEAAGDITGRIVHAAGGAVREYTTTCTQRSELVERIVAKAQDPLAVSLRDGDQRAAVPWSMRTGAVAVNVVHTPVRSTSTTACHMSSVISQNRLQLVMPALATTTSRRPSSATPSATAASNLLVAYVHDAGDGTPALPLDQPDGLGQIVGDSGGVVHRRRLAAQVGHDDIIAVGDEPHGVAAALAAGCPGHEGVA